ncbi:quinone oxidoreductase [Streptomyces avermitilis]|uniref:Oxidoreductase n=1 Tax=Streptomyces avermitilis TaxID=33903 RepID=A0A4D4M9C2_STRAX|nr:NADPH:quinone reductase [Streptomyces avermitilis]OOV21346.1 quinone oxidoreductase [Streptomyces avermitilis]GDY68404.1 oxidoreductase [Streptomyces avermitilis]
MYGIQASEFGSEDVLAYTELAAPQPRAGQARVRMHAAGVNPADTYIRSGTYEFFRPDLPYTPGFDGAGVVDQVGAGVDTVKPGDRVFVAALGTPGCTGTYAELAVADAAAVRPLPSSLSFAQGAAIGVPCVTAWRALFQRARLQPGETVFIHGASGGVGLHATQLAHAAGAVVIGSASTPAGADLVRTAGAAHVLDHGSAGYLDELTRITDGRGPSVIIEMAAHLNLERDLTVLATAGRVVIVGSRGSLDFTPRLAMVKEATILGLALWNATPAETADALTGVAARLHEGSLVPVVGNTLPLREAAAAHRQVLEHGTRGKLVLIPE